MTLGEAKRLRTGQLVYEKAHPNLLWYVSESVRLFKDKSRVTVPVRGGIVTRSKITEKTVKAWRILKGKRLRKKRGIG
ncbi:hypothetical protein LCGC14_0968650 [marine sediment metagenome]|uniref:Uncharacterized protein n=1 Tax=marine sediment metagenome TaxID=412755 RepID=A0A0F9NCE1_9ZZZZ